MNELVNRELIVAQIYTGMPLIQVRKRGGLSSIIVLVFYVSVMCVCVCSLF